MLVAMRDGLVKEIEAKARERRAHGQTAPGRTLPPVTGEALSGGETDKVLGDMAGVGKETMRLARKVAKEGTAEQQGGHKP